MTDSPRRRFGHVSAIPYTGTTLMQIVLHRGRTLPVLGLLLLAIACGQKESTDSAAAPAADRSAYSRLGVPMPTQMNARMAKGATAPLAQVEEPPLRRYIALRHDISIMTAAEAVESAWQQAQVACVAAGCEVLASVVSRDERRRPSSASLQARVPPGALDAFLAKVTKVGSVGHHAQTADDKTDEVIDTDARLKNMVAFRDRLRGLLATPGARLKEVIEVERELVRVQSELDSSTSRRKALSQQTDMVHVNLNFQATASVLETGIWVPVREAVLGAGRVFADSLAKIIALAVFLLPWVLVALLLFVVVQAIRRRRRANHSN